MKNVLLGVALAIVLRGAPGEAAGREIHVRLKYSGSTVTREDSNHDGIKYALGILTCACARTVGDGPLRDVGLPRRLAGPQRAAIVARRFLARAPSQ